MTQCNYQINGKYAGKNIIQLAQERGSKAGTKAGAWKFLKSNLTTILGIAVLDDTHKKAWGKHSSGPWEWERYRARKMEHTADGRHRALGYDPDDPNTPGRIMARALNDHREWCRMAEQEPIRDGYGAIYLRRRPDGKHVYPKTYLEALELITVAAREGHIPMAYDHISWDDRRRADGSALHHELYDFRPDAAIICIRETEGNRYGVRTTSKKYHLITRDKSGDITAQETKIPMAKYAKMRILHYGDIIAVAAGEKKIKLLNATHKIYKGFKAVALNDNGEYVSCWDGSEWPIGKTRIERVNEDHESGLYYYQDFQEMLRAAKGNEIFGDAISHKRLAVLEVEASGLHLQYGAKLAATRITPIRQIATII